MAICENCGSEIGRLEQAFEWDGHTVCGACSRRLSGPSALDQLAAAALTERSPPRRERSSKPRVQTIERTSKRWKALSCLGVSVALLGLLAAAGAFLAAEAFGSEAAKGIAFVLGVAAAPAMLLGLVIILIANAGAWWENG